MENLYADVLILILENLPLSMKDLYDLRFVSKMFNEACSSEYLKKSKSFDRFREHFPELQLPLIDIGDLKAELMMQTPICEKVFKTYYPYIPPKARRKGYKTDAPPEVMLEKFKDRLTEDCFKRMKKFLAAHKKFDKEGGVVDFTIFHLHDYVPLLQKELKENEARLPVFIHKLAMVKFFERFPEITIKNKVERENEIIKAMKEGRKLQSYRFIDAIVLTEKERKTDIETVDLGKVGEGISPKDVEVETKEDVDEDNECKFWPERYISLGEGGNRYLKPLHITDLIALCCQPPYRFTDNPIPLPCEKAIRESLWENFENMEDYEILVWANMKSDFASEFDGGTDYWGNYLVTYYVKSLNIIIVGYGNATD